MAARTFILPLAAALGLAAGAAHADGWGGRYGVHEETRSAESAWSFAEERSAPPCDCGPAAVGLPASFFDGDAGVGPWPDFGGGGGGGGFVSAGGEAEASASASASARVSVRFSGHSHQGHGGHGGKPCGHK